MLKFVWKFTNRKDDEKGASAVEYGLLVAAIAAIIIALVFVLGKYVKGAFKTTCDSFQSNGVGGVTDTCPS